MVAECLYSQRNLSSSDDTVGLAEGPAERSVPVCAHSDEIVECEDIGILGSIKQLLEEFLVDIDRRISAARYGIGMRQ